MNASKTVVSEQNSMANTVPPVGNAPLEKLPGSHEVNFRNLPIQAKLTVGAVDDPLEKEADTMADQIMRMPEDTFIQKKCSACEEEDTVQRTPLVNFIQKKGGISGTMAPEGMANSIEQSRGKGRALPKGTKSFMESRFGTDFSGVNIHTGSNAIQMSRELGAKAFTVGNDIYFNHGQFNPHSNSGKHLLAHELTHVVQQNSAGQSRNLVQRWQVSQEDPTRLQQPPSIGMSVSLSGLRFYIDRNAYFSAGDTQPQLMAAILRRLLEGQYRLGMETEAIAHLNSNNVIWSGSLSSNSRAVAGQLAIGSLTLDTTAAMHLLSYIEDFGLQPVLSDEQKELLRLGASVNDIYNIIQTSDNPLPTWYTKFMFARVMANNANMLRLYHSHRLLMVDGTSLNGREGLIEQIRSYVGETAQVLEVIRQDYDLGNFIDNLNARDAYRRLTGKNRFEFPRLYAAPETLVPESALNFMQFIRTQTNLLAEARHQNNRNARINLLARFERFHDRAHRSSLVTDEHLSNSAPTATDRAWPAEMTSNPGLQAPLYEASLAANYRFTMSMQMDHWINHFALYTYQWERARITRPPSENHGQIELIGLPQTPTHSEFMDLERRRVRRYNEADIDRVIEAMGTRPSLSALGLVAANNILRTFANEMRGEVIRVTESKNEKVMTFPESGLFMVKCKAVPILEGDEEVVRLPSVSYMIVNVMDPVDLAITQHTRTMDTRTAARERIEEINTILQGNLSHPDAADLEQELLILQDIAGSLDHIFASRIQRISAQLDPLVRQQQALQAQIDTLREQDNPNQGELDRLEAELYMFRLRYSRIIRGLQGQKEDVEEIMEAREEQHADFTGSREQVDATFVNDSGVTINLVMEATLLNNNEISETGENDRNYRFVVADLTTNTGGLGRGEGNSRYLAISNAVVNVLETHGDYGRGNLVLTVDGQHFHRPVHAGAGAIFMEALESVTMVASIAAIIASPFTGGASLYLLLPLGVAGALPSLYRLYQRYDAGNLRPDMEVAMDMVNAIGGFIGLAHGATSAFRVVRLGRVLLVSGFVADGGGYILMGASIVDQLNQIQNLPAGERNARFIEIMFNALVQVGMIAGGSLAQFHAQQQAHQRRRQARSRSDLQENPTATSEVPVLPETEVVHPPRSTEEGRGNTPTDIRDTIPDFDTRDTIPEIEAIVSTLEFTGGDVASPPARRNDSLSESTRYRQDADQMYDNMWQGFAGDVSDQARARQQEVAMFRNNTTGEIILVQGDRTSVFVTESDSSGRTQRVYPAEGGQVQQWKDILNNGDLGRWDLIAHSHPIDQATGVVSHRNRFPSGANGDFSAVVYAALQDGSPTSSRIDYMTPDGPDHTIFGITPGTERPVWIEFPDPATGQRRTVDFPSIEAYHTWFESHFGGNMGTVPDGYRNLNQPPRGSQAHSGDRVSIPRAAETGAEHERRVVLQDRASRATDPDNPFSMTLDHQGHTHGEPANTFARIRDEIATRLAELSSQHGTDAMPHFNPDVLQQRTIEFIMAHSELRPLYQELYQGLTLNDPRIRRSPAWRNLSGGTLAFMRRNFENFFHGFVHSRKPDIVDIDFRNGMIHVTDPTLQNNPFHHFKTLFYAYVLAEMTGYRLTAQDVTLRPNGLPVIRVLLDQTPVPSSSVTP